MVKLKSLFARKIRNVAEIIEEPKIINAILKGIPASYVRDLFIIKKMTNIVPKTIIDVGSHFGEAAIAMNYVFPSADIYSFEPVKSSYNILKMKTKNIPKIQSYNFGVGDKNKKTSFWLNNFSAASSLLDTEKQREKIFKITKSKKKIEVEIKRFDSLKDIKLENPTYLKIDIEGAEKLALEGFGELIKNIDVLQIEYNFKKLYKNQTELKDILEYVKKAKLDSFIQLGNHVTKDGIVYCDLIFFRKTD